MHDLCAPLQKNMTRLHNEQHFSGHLFEKRGLQDGLDMERTIHVLIQSMFFHNCLYQQGLLLPHHSYTIKVKEDTIKSLQMIQSD